MKKQVVVKGPDLCIQVQEKPILKSEVPHLQGSNDVLQKVDKIYEQMQTIGTGNLDDAQCTQEPVMQTGEESMEKDSDGKPKVENEGQNKTSDNSDAYGDRSRNGKTVGERLNVTMVRNDQESKENSIYKPEVNFECEKDIIQKNVTDKAEKSSNQNSNGEGSKCDEIDPEHVITQGFVKNNQLSEVSTNVDSTFHLFKRNLTPSNENNQKSSGDERSTDVNDGLENGCDFVVDRESHIVKMEVPISEKSKEVFEKLDEIFKEMQMAGTRRVSDEQHSKQSKDNTESANDKENGNKGDKTRERGKPKVWI